MEVGRVQFNPTMVISLKASNTMRPACGSFARLDSAAAVLFPCPPTEPPIRTTRLTDFINFSPPIDTANAIFVNGLIAHSVISSGLFRTC